MKSPRNKTLIREQLNLMRVGHTVTFTRPIKQLPAKRKANELAMMLNAYFARYRPGCKFTTESFITMTYAGNAHAGVIVTLVSDPVLIR